MSTMVHSIANVLSASSFVMWMIDIACAVKWPVVDYVAEIILDPRRMRYAAMHLFACTIKHDLSFEGENYKNCVGKHACSHDIEFRLLDPRWSEEVYYLIPRKYSTFWRSILMRLSISSLKQIAKCSLVIHWSIIPRENNIRYACGLSIRARNNFRCVKSIWFTTSWLADVQVGLSPFSGCCL